MSRILVFAVALGALLVSAALPAPAIAQETPRLSGPVTDLANAVDSTGDIEDAIDELQRETGTQLFVLYVETTGDTGMEAFTDEVVEVNNLGASDALLAVAIEDQTYQLYLGDLATDNVSQDEQDTLLASEVEPELRDGDFAGAAIAAASGINAAIDGSITGGGGNGDDGDGGGISFGAIVLIIGVVAVLGFGAYWLFTSWRADRESAEERDRRTGELAKKANFLLLESDDMLRDAEQELGFAEAEFSPEDVAPFRDALRKAREEVQHAFEVRQKLDDGTPETPGEREDMLNEIIARCDAARALIIEQTRQLDEARDLERRAPEVLEALPGQIASVEERVERATENLERLQRYAESSWRAVQGNIIEAKKRIEFARAEVDAGQTSVAADDRKRAAAAVRSSQKALGDANELLEAIDALAASMQEAQSKLATQMPTAAEDIRTARAALRNGASDLSARVEHAEQALAEARQLAATEKPDVLAAYRLAVEAEAVADDVLRATQEAAEARTRERHTADAAIASAEASYQRAGDFVRSRRGGGIGRTSRTRLSEAARHLDRARELVESNPRSATDEARAAQRLADDALRLGQDDFGVWGRPGRRGSLGSMGLGIALGGILFGGGGGFGGTRWGSPGRGGLGGLGGLGGGRSRGGRW